MSTAIFYHAGCPVCIEASQMVVEAIDPNRYTVEIVHLGDQPERCAEAEASGVNSVPALVLNGRVFHINFGAALSDLMTKG